MTDAPPGEDGQTKPFAAVLQELNSGRTHTDLSDTLQALVEAVNATGKKGTLQLTLTVEPSKAHNAMDVTATVRSKLPEPKQFATIFYVDSGSNLVRNDPRQTELDLGPVKVADAPGKASSQ